MGRLADMNGNKLLWLIVSLIIGGCGTTIWKLHADMAVVQEQMRGMAPQVADIHQHITGERWRDYSAWQYQLQVNDVLYSELDIPHALRPTPPNHLREIP